MADSQGDDAAQAQAGKISADFVLVDGSLVHKRWVGADGKRKTGRALELAMIQVELEGIAQTLLRISRDLG